MFSNEHRFDATVITLVDEGAHPLREDVVIEAYDDRICIRQYDDMQGEIQEITLSQQQLKDLISALDLPEGVFRSRS